MCNRDIYIYKYINYDKIKNNFNYLCNDMLLYQYILLKYSDINKQDIRYFTESVELSVITNPFEMNDENEIETGYIQDYDEDISFCNYEFCDIEDKNKIFDEKYKGEDIDTGIFLFNRKKYIYRQIEDNILIYCSDYKLKDVEVILSKKYEIISRVKNELKDGLKKIVTSDNVYYIQNSKIKLTNYCVSIIEFKEDILRASYLIKIKININDFAEYLYSRYSDKKTKTQQYLIDLTRKKFDKKKKYNINEQDIDLTRRKRKRKKIKSEEEEEHEDAIEGDEDVNFYDNEEKNEYTKFMEQYEIYNDNEELIDENFIFWDNIPTCFEFLGVLSFSMHFHDDNIKSYYLYLYKNYYLFKEIIKGYNRLFFIFKKIVLLFYDTFSVKIQYDKLNTITKYIEEYYELNKLLKTVDEIKYFKKFVESFKLNSKMLDNFVNNEYIRDELIVIIDDIIKRIINLDYKNLETDLRNVGINCLNVMYNGKNSMLNEIRSASSFLGNVFGIKKGDKMQDVTTAIVKAENYLMKNIKKKRMSKKKMKKKLRKW